MSFTLIKVIKTLPLNVKTQNRRNYVGNYAENYIGVSSNCNQKSHWLCFAET
jgi:hypothetical protein